jgi:hypothetical protein
MMMLPVPKDMSYDAKVGLTAARDGILEAITGTIVSDKPGKLGGLPGRAVRAKAVLGHKPYRVDLLLAWDATHHTMSASTPWPPPRARSIAPPSTRSSPASRSSRAPRRPRS